MCNTTALKEEIFRRCQIFIDENRGNESDVARALHEMLNFYVSDPDKDTAHAFVMSKLKKGGLL